MHTRSSLEALDLGNASALAPHVTRWRRWLNQPASRDPKSGLWLSWLSPDGSGYPYEEATAWALGEGLSNERALAALRDVLSRRPLQRDGDHYLFDTAVALDAAISLADPQLREHALAHVLTLLKAAVAVGYGPVCGAESAATRWSEAFGAHVLWLIRPLARLGMHEQAAQLFALVWPRCERDGLPSVHGATHEMYAHSAAYAAEGMAFLPGRAHEVARSITVALLARAQVCDGLIPAFYTRGPLRCDVAAQTWYLAQLLGIEHPATAMIERALVAQTAGCGGVRYEPGSNHINTCVTVFALRAAEFVANRTFVQ